MKPSGPRASLLGALVVASPDRPPDRETIAAELRRLSGPEAGFRSFERVNSFELIPDPLTPENGYLTATLKMRRNVIAEAFRGKIDGMYGGGL